MLFDKKTAVVTGCVKRIGKTIAEEFKKKGASVWALDELPNDYAAFSLGKTFALTAV